MWAKLDDGFHENPKILNAGNEAAGAFCRCLSYCARHLTDGYLPDKKLREIAGRRPVVDALVNEKLIEQLDNGWWIPDYLEFNMESEKAQEERRKAKERMAKLRAERRAALLAKQNGGVRD